MSVTLTEPLPSTCRSIWPAAARALACAWASKPPAVSGMAYKLEFADQVEPDDKVWESFGVKVLVDEKSLPYLDGTELDYTREGLQEGFKFHNPNEKSRCGCGESFQI